MNGNKRKRLSLKSKKASSHEDIDDVEFQVSKKRKIQSKTLSVSKRKCKGPEEKKKLKKIAEDECIETSSDDDVICLTDEVDGSPLAKYTRSSLLDVDDENLRGLRSTLLELRRLQPHIKYENLPSIEEPEDREKLTKHSRETTLGTYQDFLHQEYSPLPQLCPACSHHKPIKHDFATVIEDILRKSEHGDIFTVTDETQPGSEQTSVSRGSPENKMFSSKTNRESTAMDYETVFVETTQKKAVALNKSRKSSKTDTSGFPEKFTDVHSTSKTSDAIQSVLSACPLCSTPFERGTSQLDIDGHIAACLSSAGDDVMW